MFCFVLFFFFFYFYELVVSGRLVSGTERVKGLLPAVFHVILIQALMKHREVKAKTKSSDIIESGLTHK